MSPPLVVVGGSTGAPAALQRFLLTLSRPLPASMLIVLHVRSPHDRSIASRLDKALVSGAGPFGSKVSPDTPHDESRHEGRELQREGELRASDSAVLQLARDAERLQPGMIRMAPAGLHMRVEAGAEGEVVTRCAADAPIHGCCPAVDPLFESAAAVAGERVIGVVLTGMGRDGARGAAAIRAQGGQILVQDEASSVVWGMAGEVAGLGLADAVLGPEDLARALEECLRRDSRFS